ncbi:MAG TPA: hypothetical protein VGB82_04670 [Alphaproteobacteria bacterium]
MSSRKAMPKKTGRAKAAPATRPRGGGDTPSTVATRLAADVQRGLADGKADVLTPEAVQALMAAVCKTYAAQIEAGGEFMPLNGRSGVTATDIMVTASKLLRAGNLQVFELGMWQSWTGR